MFTITINNNRIVAVNKLTMQVLVFDNFENIRNIPVLFDEIINNNLDELSEKGWLDNY